MKRSKFQKMNRKEMIERLNQLWPRVREAGNAEATEFPVDLEEYNRLLISIIAGMEVIDASGDARSFHVGRRSTPTEMLAAHDALEALDVFASGSVTTEEASDTTDIGPERQKGASNASNGETTTRAAISKSIGKRAAAEMLFGPGGFSGKYLNRKDAADIAALGDALRRHKVTVITVTAAGIVLATAVGLGLYLLLRPDGSCDNAPLPDGDECDDDLELGPAGDDEDEGPAGD